MGHASGHGRRKVGVALQGAAMVMLLCAPHLPLLVRALAVHGQAGRCAMDHLLCGCAPERIASRTCCCFQSMKHSATTVKPGCCDLPAMAHEEANLDNDAPPGSPRLESLPCGQDPRMVSQVTSEVKYLRSARAPLPAYKSAPYKTTPHRDSYLSPSLEPPDPPPKNSIFA